MIALALLASAFGSELDFGYTPNPGPGETPALFITPPRAVDELVVSCEAGGRTYDWTKRGVGAGQKQTFSWDRDTSVTEASCYVRVRFGDGMVEEVTLPISYSFGGALSVDLSKASADIAEHTLTVRVTGPVETAEIVAYGAGRAELERREVTLSAGPGELTLPWAGDPAEVVLLDITVRNSQAWAGFTFSPWFMDIPHDDVLFDTNSDVITPDEEWKLKRTLEELHDVLDKYGDIVPVKLYIAGCTDTVGDAGSNRALSQRRAKAIAAWLRAHGYDKPIYYYGFGEGLLAVPTGDGVDEVRNRRVLYMVGASPPPAGSGVPSVGWIAL
ncbi:MAG: OmpA family protein [Alphaproteobacteria bacterium]|nr:OmpA family protein [Alphaproteobacteria bacterium]